MSKGLNSFPLQILRGCSSMVEHEPCKFVMRVQFSPAPPQFDIGDII